MTSTTIGPGNANGNVTQMKMYDYADLTNPARTSTYSYLHNTNSNYVSKHIFNRVDHVTVQKPGGSVITLVENGYDYYPNGMT